MIEYTIKRPQWYIANKSFIFKIYLLIGIVRNNADIWTQKESLFVNLWVFEFEESIEKKW